MKSRLGSRRGGRRWLAGIGLSAALAGTPAAVGETMLQYFNTSWKDMADKIPELAEAGYSSIWLPPPTKGSGGLSVGYDLCDPFDLGGRSQRGTVTTRYGTEAELLNLIELAHRFGLRVYADNIMNHRAFDIPATTRARRRTCILGWRRRISTCGGRRTDSTASGTTAGIGAMRGR